MSQSVRVRFAPSPTGHLHVGGARTALFNWLYARHHGGMFILRIEDTDRSRSTDDNIDDIVAALRWLGLDWDEGPPSPGYRQTERFDLYREHARRLVAAGRAYYCACTPEQLEAERAEAQAKTEALGYPVPAFAHVSMILGPDRARLSKRHGATSVQAYREQGILPEAMVNYLARLGWSSGDQEIFSRAELVERFDIKDVSSSGAIFDQTKLEWLNHEYIKTVDGRRLATLVTPFLTPAGLTPPAEATRFVGMLDTLRERGKTLRELVEVGRFYFERPSEYDARSASKLFTPAGVERLGALIERLAAVEPFTPASLEALYRELAEAMGLKLVDLAQLTRLAVTGRTASPPLFDVLGLLGREETLARLRAARDAAAKAAR